MKHNLHSKGLYKKSSKLVATLIVFASIFTNANAAINDLTKECENCFSAELVTFEEDSNCVTVELEINASAICSSALSHLTIEVPCGSISNVTNSGGWKIENPSNDPTTGITGFKIDNIHGFGEDNNAGTFNIGYTVCLDDAQCITKIKEGIKLAYKAGNCIFYEEIKIADQLSAIISKGDVTCYEGNNGFASIEIVEGVAPFTFLWNTESSSQSIDGLHSGEYFVSVTDSTGATIELSTTILQPEFPINITKDISFPSCGQNDGAIKLSVSGGTEPYIYSWNDGSSSDSLVNLNDGTFTIQVTDSMGCSKYETIALSAETDIAISLKPNYLECFQEGEGTVESKVAGGQQPYAYLWSNDETSENLSQVNSGSYSLTVTDSNGCTATSTTYVGIKKMSLSTAVTNPSCFGYDDGKISITDVRYGNEPYNYLWNTGDTSSSLNDISSGRYQVTVTDAYGCTINRTINLADRRQLELSYSISRSDCSSDSTEVELYLSATGGTPNFIYYKDETEVSIPVTLWSEGTSSYTVIDAFGCEASQEISINSVNSDFSVSADIDHPACGGNLTGNAQLITSGGTAPYVFSWSDGYTGKERNNIQPGIYQIEAVDSDGCSATTEAVIDSVSNVSASIIPPTLVKCESDNNMLYSNSSGADTYTWEFIGNDTWYIETSSKNELVYHAGIGAVTVTYSVLNAEGCFASDTIQLNCTNEDDGSGGNNPGDSIPNIVFADDCFFSEISKITPIGDNCYQFEMMVYTNGHCEHELSHLSVGLDNATVNWLENSRDWKMEMNSTDPKTGIYGFKIDDISGFGQNGYDRFKITFEACFYNNEIPDYFPETITVAYKSANAYTLQLVNIKMQQNLKAGLTISVFPNPFKDIAQLTIVTESNTNVNIEVYDISGNKVESVYNGELKSEIKYTFKITGGDSKERILFYKVISDEDTVQGKLLKTK
ncbi:hypothetical protein [Saccharicrinis sp. GN24d3]|uniref:hypothetical protein n=1 Tax=Saccharicrinis sp. GN24d3 TaxID=3458416 RepID=UPI0040361B91